MILVPHLSPLICIHPWLIIIAALAAANGAQLSLPTTTAARGANLLLPVSFASRSASVTVIQFDLQYDSGTWT